MAWVDNDVVLRARESLAEYGFEHTPNQIRDNERAMEILAEWSKPQNQQRLNALAEQLNNRIDQIVDMRSLHKALEEILGTTLSCKDVAGWLSLLKIFL